MSTVKITKRVVDGADLAKGRHYIWDSELRGFGVQVEKTGTRTYIVRYRLKGQGRSGRRKFFKLGRHGDLTAEEARESAKRTLGVIADGGDPASLLKAARQIDSQRANAITFKALAERFLNEHVAPKRKPATYATYETLLRRHAYPLLGDKSATDISDAEMEALHTAMNEKQASANRLITTISSMYTFAGRVGVVQKGFNPVRDVERFKEHGRERYLTSDELQHLGLALLDAETIGIPWEVDHSDPKSKHTPKTWKGQRDLLDPYAVAAIRLLLFTGARLREVLNLKWEHVDLERGLLFLPDSKTGKKTIILNSASSAILVRLMALANGGKHRPVSGYVIRGDIEGKPRSDLKRPWAAVRRHAGLDGVRLHDLRHTFASIGAGASLGLPVVGRLLGHSQPQTTARYAHLDADPLRRAADIIGDRITAAMALRPIPGKAADAAE
jgi:integrase